MNDANGFRLMPITPIISDKEFMDLARSAQNNIARHANICAKRINSYWAERGKDANARVEDETVRTYWGETYHVPVIKSALRNGIPVG